MNTTKQIDRRAMMKAVGAGAGVALAGAGSALAAESEAKKKGKGLSFRNEDFYTNGKFDLEAAKDAILELFNYHHYPVFKGVRDKLYLLFIGWLLRSSSGL